MKHLIHPGEILQEEFLAPHNLTAYRLSLEISVQQTRISQILKGKRSITADTALRLSNFFGNSPEFWLNLQADYDLRKAKSEHSAEYASIKPFDYDGEAA